MSFTACEKNNPVPEPSPVKSLSGVFILNQGSSGMNDAGISYYDFETGQLQFDIANQLLGDTGEDMIAYGNKLYVSVWGSSRITIFDLTSRTQIQAIDFDTHQPYCLASYDGKVYATTTDGYVVRIDTASLSQDGITAVGLNPVGIAAANGKLYVANSGGYNYPNFNNTLSIVDIATFKEENTLTVGLNPNAVHADSYGNVYLTYLGNYVDVPGGFQRIDPKTNAITNISISANEDFVITGDSLYFYGVTYNPDYSANNTFGIYNVKTGQLVTNQLITDGTTIHTAYGLGVNAKTGDVYISDTDYSNPGTVYVFGPDGKKKNTLNVGINACWVVFY
jgi:WD40 repeat protein